MNILTAFEVLCCQAWSLFLQGLDAMGYKEHIDYDLVESTNPSFGKAVVRVNVFRGHRQVRGLHGRIWGCMPASERIFILYSFKGTAITGCEAS